MVKPISYFLLALVLLSCSEKKSPKVEVSIIPKPNHLVVEDDKAFEIDKETWLIFNGDLKPFDQTIKDYFKTITGYKLPIAPTPSANSISFTLDSSLPEEAYTINSDHEKITITGGSEKALMHAFQTLRQILITQNETFKIPAFQLHDSPRFQWRGMLLDCARHFMDKDFIKRYIDLLALYKMNTLHWHLTEDQGWRIEIKKYPKLTEIGAWRDDGKGGKYGGFYTQVDIKEIVAYATARGVKVVPEIELPGHSQAALAAYPQFSCTGGPFEVETEWGVFKDIYCAGNDSTFIFLKDVLTEVIELFPSEYIHIGGDEAPKYRWEHCEKCQRRIKEEGLHDEHELQSYFINRVGKFLESNGKKMIGWDEILEGGLPEGAIVQSWRGFGGAVEAAKHGHKAILSPTSHAYFDYGLNDIDMKKVYGFDPIPGGLTQSEEQLIIGGECNMWSERAPQQKVDSKVFPRLMAMSEVLWSDTTGRDYAEFRDRVNYQYKVLDKLDVNYGFETVPVSINTETKNGDLTVALQSYDSAINIFYHDDNQQVDYKKPVVINEATQWAITFSKNGNTFKDTIYQKFIRHLANGIIPKAATDFNESYTAGGLSGLTDGKKGSTHFRDGNWQGYWGPDIELLIDLNESREINELSSGYLQYNNAWIFFPVEVTYFYSTDGETFEKAGEIRNQGDPKDKEQLTQEYRLNLKEPLKARYVKLVAKNMGICPDWHDAAGNKAWLFIDEFSVK